MDVRSKVYTYRTAVKWTEQRKGVISCAGKPDVAVATPPEFKGHDGIWSPEDLFVASANICLMTTFLSVAERAGLAFISYESEAVGKLELVDGKFQFTAITLKPVITLPAGGDAAKAKELIDSLPPAEPEQERSDAQWLAEIERRARAAQAGAAGISWEEARQQALDRLPNR